MPQPLALIAAAPGAFGVKLVGLLAGVGWAAAACWRRPSALAAAAAPGTTPRDPVPAPGSIAPLRVLQFAAAATCQRAWNKPPVGDEARQEWRGEAYCDLDCGEDSFMVTPRVLGVADGVGGWRLQQVDPSIFANRLMQAAAEGALAGLTDPVKLMERAYFVTLKTVQFGSSTCCIASLSPEGRLKVANLGDSGLLVIRDGAVVHRTQSQQYGFNFPLQLSTHCDQSMKPTLPTDSGQTEVQVQPGDIVFLATDGLLDNVFEPDIATMISRGVAEGQPLSEVAATLQTHTVERSRDPTYFSPFAMGAQKAGLQYNGGKADDVTIVIAKVEALG